VGRIGATPYEPATEIAANIVGIRPEHAAIKAMEVAVAEVCRLTRQDICAGFFNMCDGDEHIVKNIDDYHWNKLSMSKTKAIFERHASAVEVIHIDTFLVSRFGCGDTHNKGAYTFIIRR